jgi:hypothetical protein
VSRITVASHFVHNAIVGSGLDRFIHFFIALDALFGERDGVGAAISAGVCALPGVKADAEHRVDQLYSLRNALLHGGSGTIERWVGYKGYLQRFGVRPNVDVAEFALLSLRHRATLPLHIPRRTRKGAAYSHACISV